MTKGIPPTRCKYRGDVFTRGFEVREVWYALADTLEVVQRQLNLCRVRNRQEVQNGVRGAAHRHNDTDAVFKGFFSEDVAWFEIVRDEVKENFATLGGAVGFLPVLRRHR